MQREANAIDRLASDCTWGSQSARRSVRIDSINANTSNDQRKREKRRPVPPTPLNRAPSDSVASTEKPCCSCSRIKSNHSVRTKMRVNSEDGWGATADSAQYRSTPTRPTATTATAAKINNDDKEESGCIIVIASRPCRWLIISVTFRMAIDWHRIWLISLVVQFWRTGDPGVHRSATRRAPTSASLASTWLPRRAIHGPPHTNIITVQRARANVLAASWRGAFVAACFDSPPPNHPPNIHQTPPWNSFKRNISTRFRWS